MPPASKERSVWSGAGSASSSATVSIDSEVSLVTTENRGFTVAVGLDVSLPGISDPERAISIVAAAHEVCPYSNATRGNIEVTLTGPTAIRSRLHILTRSDRSGL